MAPFPCAASIKGVVRADVHHWNFHTSCLSCLPLWWIEFPASRCNLEETEAVFNMCRGLNGHTEVIGMRECEKDLKSVL